MIPVLYIIIPCYNEENVLPITSTMFLEKLKMLIRDKKIDSRSRILFVDDGSKDETWNIIQKLSEDDEHFAGIALSRNRGHQNALLCGLMESKDICDITISIDCDGQDDIEAMDEMIAEYRDGCEIVYGVRKNRDVDTFFKRNSAQLFYRFLHIMGVEVVYNHADYRLISCRVLKELEKYKEVNIYLRGMIPLVGFKSSSIFYDRKERMAGKTHYPLRKMLALAMNGVTSLSIKPLQMITVLGCIVSIISFLGALWTIGAAILGKTVTGWASMTCIICFLGGIQLICLGILGEYIGKIYMETKERPRWIISDRTKNERMP